MSGRLVKLSWVLALVALAGSVIFAVAKVGADRPLAVWAPTAGEPLSVPLVMAAPTPAELVATAPCDALRPGPGTAIRTGSPTEVLGTSGSAINEQALRIKAQDSLVWAEFGGRPVTGARLQLPVGSCTLRVSYDGADDSVTLAAGGTSAAGVPAALSVGDQNPPRAVVTVTGLSTAPSLIGKLDVRVTSATIGHQLPGWRPFLGALVILCGLAVLVLRYRCDRGGGTVVSTPTPRWTGSDTAVAVVVCLGLVLSLPDFDDGWVLTTVREFAPIRVFSNYYQNQATAQPQGFWWAWLQQLWLVPAGTPAFLLRLPAAVLGIGSWWLLRRRVIDQVLPAGSLRLARVAGVLVVVAAVPSLVLLLRPEPVVAVLVAATLALCVRYARRPDPWVLGVLALLGALALSVHQTGWAVVVASLSVIPGFVRWARSADRPWTQVVPLVVGPLAIFIVLLLAGSNIWLWWQSVGNFTGDDSYSSVLDEVTRLHGLTAGFSAVPSRVLFFGVVIMGLLAYLVRSPTLRTSPPSAAGSAAALAVLGLAMTADKLPSHAAAVVPAVALLLAMAVVDLGLARASGTRLVVGLAGAVAISYLATRGIAGAPSDWDGIRSSGPGSSTPGSSAWWLGGWAALAVALVAIVVSWLFLGRSAGVSPADDQASGDGRAARPLLWTIGAAVSLSVAASFVPAAVQGTDSLSWVGQNLAALGGQGCGLAGSDGVKLPTAVAQLPLAPNSSLSAPQSKPVAPPGVVAAPVAGAARTVAQAATPIPDLQVLAAPAGSAGTVTTPRYRLPQVSSVAFWALSGAGPITLELDYRDAVGAAVSAQTLTREGELNTWQAYSMTVPEGAAEVSLRWVADSGPLAVTPPQRVLATTSLQQISGGSSVWNNPQTHLQASCLPMPGIQRGIVEPFTYSVGRPILTGRGYLSEVPAGQLACPVEQPTAAARCVYRLAPTNWGGLVLRPNQEGVGWL